MSKRHLVDMINERVSQGNTTRARRNLKSTRSICQRCKQRYFYGGNTGWDNTEYCSMFCKNTGG